MPSAQLKKPSQKGPFFEKSNCFKMILYVALHAVIGSRTKSVTCAWQLTCMKFRKRRRPEQVDCMGYPGGRYTVQTDQYATLLYGSENISFCQVIIFRSFKNMCCAAECWQIWYLEIGSQASAADDSNLINWLNCICSSYDGAICHS